MIDKALKSQPLVAILRGIRADEVKEVGAELYDHGVRCIEVPLNSPSPLDSISELASSMPADCVVGAGTVLASEDVRRVRDAGGTLIVAPNTSRKVIEKAVALDMHVMPGIATPTDAFRAIEYGARILKLFPAGTYGPNHLTAMRAVLPSAVKVLAVGGVDPAAFDDWRAAGVAGFGLGSAIFQAGDGVTDVREKIAAIVAALWQV